MKPKQKMQFQIIKYPFYIYFIVENGKKNVALGHTIS